MKLEDMIIILAFIFPGAFSKILLSTFCDVRKDSKGYIEICEYISVSFGVLILNFIAISVFNKWGWTDIKITGDTALNKMPEINITIGFIIQYLILTVISTIVVTIILWLFIRYGLVIIKKVFNKKNYIYGDTVWQTLFYTKNLEFNIDENPLIEIIKDGEIIEIGQIQSMNEYYDGKKEFILCNCNEMKAYLENDKEREKKGNEKIFNKHISYCNLEEKIVVKVYDMKRYQAYQAEQQSLK